MDILFSSLEKNVLIKEINDIFTKRHGNNLIYGASSVERQFILATAKKMIPSPLVIIVQDTASLKSWQENLTLFLPNTPIEELPQVDILNFDTKGQSIERKAQHNNILLRLLKEENFILLATAESTIKKVISKKKFFDASISLHIGQNISTDILLLRLSKLGYERNFEVEHMGHFSMRGGILDIFPLNTKMPLRIEFFGDEITSIREFSLDTKVSYKKLTEIFIFPFVTTEVDTEKTNFLEYLPPKSIVVFDEPTRVREKIIRTIEENPDIKKHLLTWDNLLEKTLEHTTVHFTMLLQKIHNVDVEYLLHIEGKEIARYSQNIAELLEDITLWQKENFFIIVFFHDFKKAQILCERLEEQHLYVSFNENLQELKTGIVYLLEGDLTTGFEFAEAKLVILTEKDIFGRQKKKLYRNITNNTRNRIKDIDEIHPGDYVVHIHHGIGLYVGVKTLEVEGIKKDYFHIKYSGEDKIFVPIDQVNLLQKYIGKDDSQPKLSKLSTKEWLKKKEKIKSSVEDIAKELVDLYAKRREQKGYAFSQDTAWQAEFEDAFPYEETEDQLKAISEIKADMEKERPMDRLLCGDVGFGKTEVAVRAAFKAVMDAKQVAILVPTTVLAQQHYRTLMERFTNFGVNVDLICRFRTAKEQKETAVKVALGKVDILIGTHAILNTNKIKFHDLGLLIVDEEQRFGVKQKEKIKKLSLGVDVLSLSATPIPRTLHMSLIGVRDLSIIATPPSERYPVQSYLLEANDRTIEAAIRRELNRGGQVYFIYNRVATIEQMKIKILDLIPEAHIDIAHGQMSEATLERVMMDFYEGHTDVLLSTSIVENGLDVPNANTIIIYNADYFGLSQLYQMRGRVGRSDRMSFAYFVYQVDKVLTEEAEKRLKAMKEFAELGAGFKIAKKDLEIRGAGNLLGREQHGHILDVGFELYCQLLDEAITELETGKPVRKHSEPIIDLTLEAYINTEYIEDAMHKIEIYQRIIAIRTEEHIKWIYEELCDRFGKPSPPVINLLKIARLKNLIRNIGIKSIIQKSSYLEITLEKEAICAKNIDMLLKLLGKTIIYLPKMNVLRLMLKKYKEISIIDLMLKLMKILAKQEEKASM